MRDIDILIFGDSITYGLFDKELGGWVNRLRLYLENNKDDNKYYVLNLGIPGQSSGDILKRFDLECQARFCKEDKTVIIFAVGIKDSQKTNEINIEKFKENISNLIVQARKYTDNICFIGLTRVDESRKKNYSNNDIIKFDNELERVCTEYHIKYIKMDDLLTLEELTDGVHPNSNAHKKICDRIIESVFNRIVS